MPMPLTSATQTSTPASSSPGMREKKTIYRKPARRRRTRRTSTFTPPDLHGDHVADDTVAILLGSDRQQLPLAAG